MMSMMQHIFVNNRYAGEIRRMRKQKMIEIFCPTSYTRKLGCKGCETFCYPFDQCENLCIKQGKECSGTLAHRIGQPKCTRSAPPGLKLALKHISRIYEGQFSFSHLGPI
ncbi:hypothetical protein I7I50_11595 [Histoplasma capsulatum G186AR]|uniref:Uncharacterized protein n=1 Tax=Ajellomyces capsulatus TaxID=5037 RepID=A0A8H8D8B1_AJECA|nr:hypothetical protein I7I52_02832 [Histoplasma capsulatum]QSS70085.1 hypothetical protein I7I50_11595 [Histoplasma capsulatum G186AR]